MTTKNLTAYNEANEREISMMVGKAMCAYANHIGYGEQLKNPTLKEFGKKDAMLAGERAWAEYEATVRCIDMFVKDDLYEIQRHVIAKAEEMMNA